MEAGSNNAGALTSSQDHSAHSSSSNGPLLSMINSPACSKALAAEISAEQDATADELCAKECSNGAISFVHDNLDQDSIQNGPCEADTLQDTRKDHEFVEKECEISENFEPEADKHMAKWIPAEKPAAKVAQRVASNNAHVLRRRTFFMIRMPRAADSQLRSKIKIVELQLEEASKTRDIIRAALQLKRARKIGLLDKLKVVRDKERACKELFQKKRLQIDPFQAALNKFKFADAKFKEEEIFSEEDLDNKIARLQHRIQHESIALKEEKQLIREIKQLEAQRSQVCANDAEQAHLMESYGTREEIQEHLDILYRELDVLRAHQNQARLECEPIEKELEDSNVKIDEFVEQLEGAKCAQGAALTACKELKKCLGEQNAEFYRSKDDIRKAREFAFSKNLDQLAELCHEQVESILSLWNNDSGFRERYTKNNEHSTLRRLETLDGRSLGPDEEPYFLMKDVDPSAETLPKKNESGLKRGSQKEVLAEAPLSAGPANNRVEKPQTNEVLQGTSGSRSKRERIVDSTKSEENLVGQTLESTGLPSIPTVREPVEDPAVKQAQVAELKEKRRQEEIAKAREAAERKRKQVERAQAKAQLRAVREAERREKDREKKARKKATVGAEGVKPVEMPSEVKEREMIEDLPNHVKGSSSQVRKNKVQPPKSRRHPVVSPPSKRKQWQTPFLWLWGFLVILVIGLAVVFFVKF